MRRAQLIVNPAARGGRSAEGETLAAFAELGVEVVVHRTTAAGDGARIADALAAELTRADSDQLFVLGGDGTVMEAVGALVGKQVPVGILPGGTGNQLARHLRLPHGVAAAVRALSVSQTTSRDLGRLADGRHFALTAGLGLDASMIALTTTASKRRFGVGSYIFGAARALGSQRPFIVRIEADGAVHEREATLAMIANVGEVMSGRFSFGPGVTPSDGLLDICVFSPSGLAEGVALAARLARGDFRSDPRMFFMRGREVRISTDAYVAAQVDGELLTATDLSATVVPAGARFLVPVR